MPICHEHRCLFIHINKCGGQAIEAMLGVGEEHRSARSWRRKLPRDLWRSYFKFSVVRNPFDKMASMYHHRKQNLAPDGTRWDAKLFTEDDITFPDWVELCYSPRSRYSRKNVTNQLSMLTGWRGGVIVDEIIRFERLAEGVDAVRQRLKIPTPLPRKNASKHAHYSSYYTPRAIWWRSTYFRRDLRHFGYEFESA